MRPRFSPTVRKLSAGKFRGTKTASRRLFSDIGGNWECGRRHRRNVTPFAVTAFDVQFSVGGSWRRSGARRCAGECSAQVSHAEALRTDEMLSYVVSLLELDQKAGLAIATGFPA